MTDRELLEMAAKAAGFSNWTPYNTGLFVETGHSRGNTGYHWNPITDDGDALRLAVKLRMVIDTDYNGGSIAGNSEIECNYEPEFGYQEGMGKKDPLAATRRAIVRVAAEIGRCMK